MIQMRRGGLYVAACLSLGLVLLQFSSVAAAAPPPTTFYNCEVDHCYSIGAEPLTFSGLEGQWDDRVINMPDSEVEQDYGHLNNEMWLIMSNGQWVEEGLSEQCSTGPASNGKTCSQNGGTDSYLQFWGDAADGGQVVYFHPIKTLSADGDNHVYEIWDGSNCTNNDWQVYLDYNLIGTSTVQSTCRGDHFNVGIELYSPPGINSNEYTGGTWFHNYMQYYENSVGSWQYVNLDTTTYYTYPCGDGVNCDEDPCSQFSAGSCLNGSRDSSYTWSDNKPS